jgi:cytochrome c oxidase subunit 2
MRIGRRRLVAGGVVTMLAMLTGAFVRAQSPRTIKVVARKFVFLPSTIELAKGEPVTLEFTAPEVVMGFFAPELKLRAVILPGEVARLTFTPDKPGTFPFICDIFCGEGHEGMGGELVVT